VCMLPGTFAYTWLGYAGREAIAGGEGLIQKILLAVGLLAIVAFLPRLVTRLRRGQPAWIDAETLTRRLDREPAPTVIDVRGADEFAGPGGHIPGARNLPVDALADRLSEVIAFKDKPVTLACRTDKRSARGAAILRDAGFAEVTVLRGGMERWAALGYAVETGHAAARRAPAMEDAS
jgi:rhodanese-related sulfurtransferase